jgi:hypothetical protein
VKTERTRKATRSRFAMRKTRTPRRIVKEDMYARR